MFWTITLAVLVVVAVLAWRLGRRSTVTDAQLERQRRQLGVHDSKGMSYGGDIGAGGFGGGVG